MKEISGTAKDQARNEKRKRENKSCMAESSIRSDAARIRFGWSEVGNTESSNRSVGAKYRSVGQH